MAGRSISWSTVIDPNLYVGRGYYIKVFTMCDDMYFFLTTAVKIV